jgi:transcriptional regulator with XRE-family HTH domain
MELKDRIREAMEAANLKPVDLARKTKRTNSAVTQWLDGSIRSIKGVTAALIEQATGYSSTWITTGRGPRLARDRTAANTPYPDTACETGTRYTTRSATLREAIDTLAEAINKLESVEQHALVVTRLNTLAEAPDSIKARDSLEDALRHPGTKRNGKAG